LIKVRCVGHIKTSVGAEEVEVEAEDLEVSELVERLRRISKEKNPGFNSYNTLALVENAGEFIPASIKRHVKNGERVVLIPVSHGG
jgi:molybdopterin converting factor small subunit